MLRQDPTIREITQADINPIVNYWKDAPLSYLKAMGIDTSDLSRFDNMAAGVKAELVADYSEKKTLQPRPGDVWKMFLVRFQKLMVSGKEVQPHPAMVLTSHGVYDTHQPEKWSAIEFVI
ncbi:MAG: hypothetical protein AB8H12_03405 [Lewinella sp.]